MMTISNRNKYIEEIIHGIREDLKNETERFLNLCTDDEIQSIVNHLANGTYTLDIEYHMLKHLMHSNIKAEDYPGWELLDSMFYEAAKEKFLPGAREEKIGKLIDKK